MHIDLELELNLSQPLGNYTELSEMNDDRPIIFQEEESLCQEWAVSERRT